MQLIFICPYTPEQTLVKIRHVKSTYITFLFNTQRLSCNWDESSVPLPCHTQTRSREFSRRGGGGAFLKNRDQIINVVQNERPCRCGRHMAFRKSGGMVLQKYLKFQNLNFPKTHYDCQSFHHHIILYRFKSFMIPSGGLFWLLGGKGACAPRAPPAYGPAHPIYFRSIY